MESVLAETPRQDDDAPAAIPAASAVMSWSGGKDGMLALHRVLAEGKYKIDSLFTIVITGARVSAHGLRVELLEQQAKSLGLSLEICFLSAKASIGQFEDTMIRCLVQFAAKGVKHVISAEVSRSDVREHRERVFQRVGMKAVFPLWNEDTRKLASEFIGAGYKASVCCVNSRIVPESLAGRDYDDVLLSELPDSCDPCGENDEFHSFVYDGPLFSAPVKIEKGRSETRDGFTFTDLVPAR